jgi:hypothetical protein
VTLPIPLFLVGFTLAWLFLTTVFGVFSGWFTLASRFPNRKEKPLLTVGGQSGSMGSGLPVHMGSCLTLAACPSGLRISVWRIFGPFSRPIFVPWDEFQVEKGNVGFFGVTRLSLGRPEVGVVKISPSAWRMLALARRPDSDPAKASDLKQAFHQLLIRQWVIPAGLVAAFFFVVSQVGNVGGSRPALPPIAAMIAFPAIVFGINPLIQYVRLRRWL